MPEISMINSEGAEVGKVELSADVFGVKPNISVMHRAVLVHLSKLRANGASTKIRSEVRGGGRKPYRQKGTGRARQGSIRAPHWNGGGVVFGPHPRDYELDMPKKMRRLAVRSALSAKLADEQIKVMDDLMMDSISTKSLIQILERVGVQGKVMMVIAEPDEVIKKSARNIPWLIIRPAALISTYDLLNADTVILTRDALAKVEEAHKQ